MHQIERLRQGAIARVVAPVDERDVPPRAQQQIERGARLGIVFDHQDACRRFHFGRHADKRESVGALSQRSGAVSARRIPERT